MPTQSDKFLKLLLSIVFPPSLFRMAFPLPLLFQPCYSSLFIFLRLEKYEKGSQAISAAPLLSCDSPRKITAGPERPIAAPIKWRTVTAQGGYRSSQKHMCVSASWQRVVPRTKAGCKPESQLVPTEEEESESLTQRERLWRWLQESWREGWRGRINTRVKVELQSRAVTAASPRNIPCVCPPSNSLPFLSLTVWLSSPLCSFKPSWPVKGKSGE